MWRFWSVPLLPSPAWWLRLPLWLGRSQCRLRLSRSTAWVRGVRTAGGVPATRMVTGGMLAGRKLRGVPVRAVRVTLQVIRLVSGVHVTRMTEAVTETVMQECPFPHELAALVAELEYRPNWEFAIGNCDRRNGCKGFTLVITTCGYDSYHPELGESYRVMHYMPVPPATFNRRSWQNWLFEQLLLVERHEAAEFFSVSGERPYAPLHSPGNDPYMRTELSTAAERDTSFRGRRNHADTGSH